MELLDDAMDAVEMHTLLIDRKKEESIQQHLFKTAAK